MQRQPEKPAFFHALVDGGHLCAQIQEGLFGFLSVAVEQRDDAALLGDPKASRSVGQRRQRHRRAETLGDELQADVGTGVCFSAGSPVECSERKKRGERTG
jgi:hypothetical protein